jgi:hypothetical protein
MPCPPRSCRRHAPPPDRELGILARAWRTRRREGEVARPPDHARRVCECVRDRGFLGIGSGIRPLAAPAEIRAAQVRGAPRRNIRADKVDALVSGGRGRKGDWDGNWTWNAACCVAKEPRAEA